MWCILKFSNFVLRSMFIKSKIEPIMAVINEITAGLNCFNVLDIIKNNKDVFKFVFCPSDIFNWKHEAFVQMLDPSFSEEGCNKKQKEISSYKHFLDFIEGCFKDGR